MSASAASAASETLHRRHLQVSSDAEVKDSRLTKDMEDNLVTCACQWRCQACNSLLQAPHLWLFWHNWSGFRWCCLGGEESIHIDLSVQMSRRGVRNLVTRAGAFTSTSAAGASLTSFAQAGPRQLQVQGRRKMQAACGEAILFVRVGVATQRKRVSPTHQGCNATVSGLPRSSECPAEVSAVSGCLASAASSSCG